ncbi:formate dehydrogenase major subunit [Desulfomicrobium norvegicum]|uniref:Formate dehydrogenase major subunit n=1 Tax=Desulfomicrobium norvegicum (strain DSM 1741 / NCIMB 8310) TaxID=52561 RepID=A0A8G2C2I3_DESNO|nr:formate dehydrogenase major subunit [Desulfomicrobium norvegicum]
MLDRIVHKIKNTRDNDFILKNDKGQDVNRWESYFQLGTSQMDNEECALTHQMCRALGGLHIDHQARVIFAQGVQSFSEKKIRPHASGHIEVPADHRNRH